MIVNYKTRRIFFRNLSALIVAVALAPEIAFGAKLELPEIEQVCYWTQETRHSYCYSDEYLEALSKWDGRGIQFY